MVHRRRPTGQEWKDFLAKWRVSDHKVKQDLALFYGVTYDTAKHWCSECAEEEPTIILPEEAVESGMPPQLSTAPIRDEQFQIVLCNLTKFSQIYLVPLADLHVGSRDAALDSIQGYINWIQETPNAFTILNGDLINGATKTTKAELFEDLVTPDQAYATLRELLIPIKDKVLMITRGGHEEHIFHQAGVDFMARLAYDLEGVPYRPEGGMIAIQLGLSGQVASFTGYITHGWGAARSAGAKVNKVEELRKIADADFYVLSHDHTQAIHRLNVLSASDTLNVDSPNYMNVNRKLFINTGGFVRYEGYIRRKGYTPQDLGTPRIRLELKKVGAAYRKDLHASL